jgi:hypothetical protein
MLDLILLTDFFIRYKEFVHPVLSELSLFFKAPLGDRVVNVFRRQHQMLEESLCLCDENRD